MDQNQSKHPEPGCFMLVLVALMFILASLLHRFLVVVPQ